MQDVVVFTTIRQGSIKNEIEKSRSEVFIDTAKKLAALHIPCVAISLDCEKTFLDKIENLGVITVNQQSTGNIGSIRREALKIASQMFPNTFSYFWLEPEKPNVVRFIKPLVNLVQHDKSVLGLLNRSNMRTYPPEQASFYMFCRSLASELIGIDIDYSFGPMLITKAGIKYFLEYKGEYGDKWDSILIPRLRIIQDERVVSILEVDFKNDHRMTSMEYGNISMIKKRLDQLNNVVPSLISEWEKLNSKHFVKHIKYKPINSVKKVFKRLLNY